MSNSIFLEYLEKVSNLYDVKPEVIDICDDVKIIHFQDEGWSAFFSFGLSSANHQQWLSKPELVISVNSLNKNWGIVMGKIIWKARHECLFTYGDLFHWKEPISSSESLMDSYFLFASSTIDDKDSYIDLKDRKIHFTGMYPIYAEEEKIIDTIGPMNFFRIKEWDRFNVKRKMLDIKKWCSQNS